MRNRKKLLNCFKKRKKRKGKLTFTIGVKRVTKRSSSGKLLTRPPPQGYGRSSYAPRPAAMGHKAKIRTINTPKGISFGEMYRMGMKGKIQRSQSKSPKPPSPPEPGTLGARVKFTRKR